jgi:hypothetical protein
MAEQRHEARYDALFPEWCTNVKRRLELAFEAHGGWTRWSQLKTVTAELFLVLKRRNGQRGTKMERSIWRRLRVSFPNGIASHGREQISYFEPDGLLRRREYRVDVLDKAPTLNDAHEFRAVDGILVAMKRRVYSFDMNKRKIPDPVVVDIDTHKIAFS